MALMGLLIFGIHVAQGKAPNASTIEIGKFLIFLTTHISALLMEIFLIIFIT